MWPRVPSDAANAVLEAVKRERGERDADFSAYNEWLAERKAKREQIAKAAYERGLTKARQEQLEIGRKISSGEIPSGHATGSYMVGPADTSTRAAGRAEIWVAVRKFDLENPDDGFEAWRTSKAVRARKGRR